MVVSACRLRITLSSFCVGAWFSVPTLADDDGIANCVEPKTWIQLLEKGWLQPVSSQLALPNVKWVRRLQMGLCSEISVLASPYPFTTACSIGPLQYDLC